MSQAEAYTYVQHQFYDTIARWTFTNIHNSQSSLSYLAKQATDKSLRLLCIND